MKPAEEWSVKLKGQAGFHRRAIVRAIQSDAKRHDARIAALTPMRPHAPEDVNYESGMKWMREKIVQAILDEADRLEGK
jgi:hypothetical protein